MIRADDEAPTIDWILETAKAAVLRYVPPEQRARASGFYGVLSTAPTAEVAAHDLRALGFVVDYVEDRDGRRLGAARLGGVRLIDNVPRGGRQ